MPGGGWALLELTDALFIHLKCKCWVYSGYALSFPKLLVYGHFTQITRNSEEFTGGAIVSHPPPPYPFLKEKKFNFSSSWFPVTGYGQFALPVCKELNVCMQLENLFVCNQWPLYDSTVISLSYNRRKRLLLKKFCFSSFELKLHFV